MVIIYGFRNKLECLSLNTRLSWKGLPRTNTLAYYGNHKLRPFYYTGHRLVCRRIIDEVEKFDSIDPSWGSPSETLKKWGLSKNWTKLTGLRGTSTSPGTGTRRSPTRWWRATSQLWATSSTSWPGWVATLRFLGSLQVTRIRRTPLKRSSLFQKSLLFRNRSYSPIR